MSVEFTDNTAKFKAALSGEVVGFLYEVGGEIQSQTQRNSRVDTGQTKGSYKYVVDEGQHEATVSVGSDLENAIWEEFGTGEYALHGDGRKGGWFYKDEKGVGHFTRGKKPNRPMYHAFNALKNGLIQRYAEILKNSIGGQ